MELGLKILAAVVMTMMLFLLWPALKTWHEHGPKAGEGDWAAAVLPLVAVTAVVILLVLMVR